MQRDLRTELFRSATLLALLDRSRRQDNCIVTTSAAGTDYFPLKTFWRSIRGRAIPRR